MVAPTMQEIPSFYAKYSEKSDSFCIFLRSLHCEKTVLHALHNKKTSVFIQMQITHFTAWCYCCVGTEIKTFFIQIADMDWVYTLFKIRSVTKLSLRADKCLMTCREHSISNDEIGMKRKEESPKLQKETLEEKAFIGVIPKH